MNIYTILSAKRNKLLGVLRKRGGLTGHEFESLVIAEIYKQIRCLGAGARLYHLHTHDGFEVDLLIELEGGYMAGEIKMSEKVREQDARHLRKLESFLDKPLLQGFLISQDPDCRPMGENITAIPAAYFLG